MNYTMSDLTEIINNCLSFAEIRKAYQLFMEYNMMVNDYGIFYIHQVIKNAKINLTK